jgi:hypothetical protein
VSTRVPNSKEQTERFNSRLFESLPAAMAREPHANNRMQHARIIHVIITMWAKCFTENGRRSRTETPSLGQLATLELWIQYWTPHNATIT